MDELETEEKIKLLVPYIESPIYTNKERGFDFGWGGSRTLEDPSKLGQAIFDRGRAWISLLDFVNNPQTKGWIMAMFSGTCYYYMGPEETTSMVIADRKSLDRAVRKEDYSNVPSIALDMRLTSPYEESSPLQRPLIVIPEQPFFPIRTGWGRRRAKEIMDVVNSWINQEGTRIYENEIVTATELRRIPHIPVRLYLLKKEVEDKSIQEITSPESPSQSPPPEPAPQ